MKKVNIEGIDMNLILQNIFKNETDTKMSHETRDNIVNKERESPLSETPEQTFLENLANVMSHETRNSLTNKEGENILNKTPEDSFFENLANAMLHETRDNVINKEAEHTLNDVVEDISMSNIQNEKISHETRDEHSFSEIKTDIFLRETFPRSVFEKLPPIFQKPFSEVIKNKQQQDLSLITLLVALSGLLPNYYTVYDDSKIYSNLFLVIVAPFGEGKGFIKFIKRILNKTHRRKIKEAQEDIKRYEEEVAEAKKSNGEINIQDIPKPKYLRLIIPVNNSKTGMIFLLEQNGGHGVLFETEIDTLVTAVKQDYGNFSDLLRNSFQHESHSLFRKTNLESIDIEQLFLTVILSGTMNQLRSLIPDIENGLFSRFIFFKMMSDLTFHNVFLKRDVDLEMYFDDYAIPFDQLQIELERNVENPTKFIYQEAQQKEFNNFFSKLKIDFIENVNESLGGVAHRLGVICCRVSMILSFYRVAMPGNIPSTILCHEDDFANSLQIIKVLIAHTLQVYYSMEDSNKKQTDNSKNQSDPTLDESEQREHAKSLFDQGVSYRQIAKIIFNDEGKRSKVYRWLNTNKNSQKIIK